MKRILTNRNFASGYECIEIDDHGTIWWRGIEDNSEAAFPVPAWFVAEKFAECGRVFDASKLPENTIMDPFAHWCN